jgi:hypothetical protein
LIARQRDYFAARGCGVEWKLHGHDRPTDLPERLAAAGFAPEETETVVIGPAAPLARPAAAMADGVSSPDGVSQPDGPEGWLTLRETDEFGDLQRIAEMESTVWGEDRSHLPAALASELAADPNALTVVIAEVGGRVVCAGWIRYVFGTSFATLWGGSTLPEYRNRGVYSAVVAYRAGLAVRRGYDLLQVDASPNSRPILLRRGFIAVATTTPWVIEAP